MLDWIRPRMPTHWFENARGERWIPEYPGRWFELKAMARGSLGLPVRTPDPTNPPRGFIYEHFRGARSVQHSVYRIITQEEVDQCEHRPQWMRHFKDNLPGRKGRECMGCGGYQVCDERLDDWPEKWETGNRAQKVMDSAITYPLDLVMAMVRPTWVEKARQLYRWGFIISPVRDPERAILYAATMCERCTNAMAYRHGLSWGYPLYSDEWKRCGTKCQLCEVELAPKEYVPDPLEMT